MAPNLVKAAAAFDMSPEMIASMNVDKRLDREARAKEIANAKKHYKKNK